MSIGIEMESLEFRMTMEMTKTLHISRASMVILKLMARVKLYMEQDPSEAMEDMEAAAGIDTAGEEDIKMKMPDY